MMPYPDKIISDTDFIWDTVFSTPSSSFPLQTFFNKNGFVETVVESYNEHHNLIIRPDDVWAAIMTQFSLYINKNAEEFRGKFVDFEGQRTLTVRTAGSLRSVSYGHLVKQMSDEIDKNLVDPEVKEWILPKFSTTTDNDKVAVGVVFMASMKKYFKYQFSLACGIPFVTLKGTVEDWQEIIKRLEKLQEYKLEKWYSMLKPILTQFVEAKKGQVDTKFWQRICHYEAGGSGPSYISGWITAFCVFEEDGNWRYGADKANAATKWFKLDTDEIPTGIVEVDVKIDDNGVEHESVMFAGHVGTEVKADNKTLQPVLGWAIALKRT